MLYSTCSDGTYLTCIPVHVQEQCNLLYFYHEKTGSWVPVPLVWEGQVPSVVKHIKDIQVTMVIRETIMTYSGKYIHLTHVHCLGLIRVAVSSVFSALLSCSANEVVSKDSRSLVS